jgi:hypothetical protein
MSSEEGYTKFWIYTPSSSGFITGGALDFFGGGRTGPADTWDASSWEELRRADSRNSEDAFPLLRTNEGSYDKCPATPVSDFHRAVIAQSKFASSEQR